MIRERLYYTIGEVGDILDLTPSSIRYWEKHFTSLKPSKRTGTSKRKFDLKDIQMLYKIKFLLKNKNLSIKKARMELDSWTDEIPFDLFRNMVDEIRTPKITFSKTNADKVRLNIKAIRNLLNHIKPQ